jgi:RimJ/RimL family protein N-acetyltransferase
VTGRPLTALDVRLEPLDARHLERTLAWVNDPELSRLLDRALPVTATEHEQWFRGLSDRADCRYFAVETSEGRHLGNVWLWNIDRRHRRAEARIVIGDPAGTDRGIGTQALGLLTTFAFDSMGLHKLYAYVLAFNLRAKRAFEKAGFQIEGLLRADRWSDAGWDDVYLLARLQEDGLEGREGRGGPFED